jgi:hypothetical protein
MTMNQFPDSPIRGTRARRNSSRRPSAFRRLACGATAALLAVGGVFLLFAPDASASTTNGVATIADGATDATLASGGSETLFTVNLPSAAACDSDTSSGGYLVDSYLVPEGSSILGLPFVGGSPPTGVLGLVDQTGSYYGGANTAITTGQIVSIPSDLQWAPLATQFHLVSTLLTSGTTAGVWEAGIACANKSGALVDNWNTQVTFTASTSDPNGFTWSAVPGMPSSSSTTTTTATTAAGGTTSTTAAGGTTTTTDGTTSTTTAGVTSTTAAGTTSTTAAVPTTSTDPASINAATGSAGSSGGAGSSGSTGSGSTGGVLAFTGMPASVTKLLGGGLLIMGIGLMLLAGTWNRNRLGFLRSVRGRAG